MNWDAIGAVGQMLGSLAVFITLGYLAVQVRQTNKLARFETTRELMAQFNTCNQLYATDATIRRLLLKKEELSTEEAEQVYSYVDMYCNAWVTAHLAFNQGLIDEALYSGAVRDVEVALRRWPNMRQSVERWFNNYPDFKDSEFFRAVPLPTASTSSANASTIANHQAKGMR